jgi:hypothetical protein
LGEVKDGQTDGKENQDVKQVLVHGSAGLK